MRIGALLALLLVGCVTTPKPLPPAEFTLRLSPASLGRELQLTQRITISHGALVRSLDAQFEADAHDVRIAAIALGQTVASLSWDGATLHAKASAQVPEAVTADRILSDVQLAWWPVEAVRAGLPAGFTLEEAPLLRTLLLRGEPFATVTYEGRAPAWTHVRLAHQRFGYALDIESVDQEGAP